MQASRSFDEAFSLFCEIGSYPERAEIVAENARLSSLPPPEREAILSRRYAQVNKALDRSTTRAFQHWHVGLLYQRNVLEAALYRHRI